MGAWGAMPFDNDDAADWAYAFDGVDAAGGAAVLREALDVHDAEYLEAAEGSVAVAAAQVVAWLVAPDGAADPGDPGYADSVTTWLQTSGAAADATLVDHARRALVRVRSEGSELAELWAESGDDEWARCLEALEATLNGGSAGNEGHSAG